MRINKKAILPLLIIIELIVAEINMYEVEILRYSDEFFACIFFLYIVIYIFRLQNTQRFIYKMIVASLAILLIGLLSNIVYGKQTNQMAIILDIISNFKLPIICLGFYLFIDKNIAKNLVEILLPICKLFLICGMICGCISFVFDIGMRGQNRYGIWGFNFIFSYAHVYALIVLFCILVICKKSQKMVNKYTFFAAIQLAMSLKGPAMVTAVLLLVLPYVMKNKNKLKPRHFILIGILAAGLGTYQIQNYFLNENAPRFILLKYGLKTATSFFPFGSGFATYGTEMSARYYSNLHYEYGFNNMYGLNATNYQFINDNYWPSIMGQFGFLGLILVLALLLCIFVILQKQQIPTAIKAPVLSCYIYTLIASLGHTIYTTSATIIMFLGMIVILRSCEKVDIVVDRG